MGSETVDDFAHMEAAYKALSAIPVHSNRREAAFWWLSQRIQSEMRREIDSVMIAATTKMLESQIQAKTKGPQ